jgi:hypothetical protein
MICLLVVGATFALQSMHEEMKYAFVLASLCALLLLGNVLLLRKVKIELSLEVARLLYPTGAALSVVISFFFMSWLSDLIPGEGKQHFVLIFVGLGVAGFLLIRCFDMKWLRSEDEIQSILNRNKH